MKHGLLLAACGTVLIAACSDREETGSDNPTAPGIVAFAPLTQPEGCSFKIANDFAKTYFLNNTDRRNAATYLAGAAELQAGTEARDNYLFQVWELIANVGGTAAAGDPAHGAGLGNELVDCGGSSWIVTDKRAFVATLTNALTDHAGGLAVVGGATNWGDVNADNPFVFAESGQAAFGLNAYGPDYSEATWATALGRAVVVLANLSQAPQFGGLSSIANVAAYRLSLIYTVAPARPALFLEDDTFAVEICSAGLGVAPAANDRIARDRSSGQTVLQAGDLAGFCETGIPGPQLGSATRASSILAQMVDRVMGLFRPAPLQAMMFVPPWSGSTGGQGTTLGDYSSDYAVVDVVNVQQSVPSIPDQVVNQPFSFNVTVCAPVQCGQTGAIPLEDATVTVTVIGNFGTPITLSGTGCNAVQGNLSCTVHTDETGTAAFNVALNKTGSYTFSVVTSFDPDTIGPTSTNQFIVRAN